MASTNSVVLVGNLGKDPIITTSKDGSTKVAKFNIATNEYNKAEKQTVPNWHSIVAFGQNADFIGKFLKKGNKIGVTGRLNSGSYEKDGQTVYYTNILANTVENLTPKSESNTGGGSNFNDDIPF